MDEIIGAKERYRLLVEGDPREDGLLEELRNQAKDCGDISIMTVARSELMIEGENKALMKLFIWLLGSHLEKVCYLKAET